MQTLARPIEAYRRVAPRVVVAVALLASVRGVRNDFVYDDLPIIQDNTRVQGVTHWIDIISHAYWPPPFTPQLYRPLSLMFASLQYAVGHGSPIVFRIVSYVLYALVALAVLRLGERLMSWPAAFVAAVLFAAHPVHVEAVALGVNQSEILVGLIGVLMVVRYLDDRRTGALSWRDWAYQAALYATAALCKETGFVLPALLVAAESTLLADAAISDRAAQLRKGCLLFGGVAAILMMVRHAVLTRGALSVVAAKGLSGLGLGGRALLMLQVVPHWARLLVWPAHLQADYVATEFFPVDRFGIHQWPGIAIVACFLAAVTVSRRRAPVACFGLMWCAITLLPVSNIIPTGILLAERTLFLPSIGALLAAAALGELAIRRWPSALLQRALVGITVICVIFGVARSVARHSVWNSAHLAIVVRPPAS